MYLKSTFGALFFLLTIASTNNALADEYLLFSNVPTSQNADDVRRLVESHGKVRSVNCIDVKYSNRVERSCYVLMWSIEKARTVVSTLNGTNYDDRKLRVKEIYPLPCPESLKMS